MNLKRYRVLIFCFLYMFGYQNSYAMQYDLSRFFNTRSALTLLFSAVVVFGCYKLKKYLSHTFIVRDRGVVKGQRTFPLEGLGFDSIIFSGQGTFELYDLYDSVVLENPPNSRGWQRRVGDTRLRVGSERYSQNDESNLTISCDADKCLHIYSGAGCVYSFYISIDTIKKITLKEKVTVERVGSAVFDKLANPSIIATDLELCLRDESHYREDGDGLPYRHFRVCFNTLQISGHNDSGAVIFNAHSTFVQCNLHDKASAYIPYFKKLYAHARKESRLTLYSVKASERDPFFSIIMEDNTTLECKDSTAFSSFVEKNKNKTPLLALKNNLDFVGHHIYCTDKVDEEYWVYE